MTSRDRGDTRFLPCVTEDRAAAVYHTLRRRGPLRRGTMWSGYPTWIVLDDELGRACLRDARLGNAAMVLESRFGLPVNRFDGPLTSMLRNPLSRDGDEHRMLRGILSPLFTADAIHGREAGIARIAEEVVAGLRGRARADLVADFARPTAEAFAGAVVGVPAGLRPRVMHLMRLLSSARPYHEPRMARARVELAAHLDEIAAEARRAPGDNAATLLTEAHARGVLADRHELHDMLAASVFAVVDSTTATLSIGALRLLRDPDRPVHLPAAGDAHALFEDLLRLSAPFPAGGYRFATEPMTVAGQDIGQGDLLCVSLLAANLDPARWAQPHLLDPARPAPAQHLSFGLGRHYCPGAGLGRLVFRTALTRLFTALPAMTLAPEHAHVSYRRGITRHPNSVPVDCGGGAP